MTSIGTYIQTVDTNNLDCTWSGAYIVYTCIIVAKIMSLCSVFLYLDYGDRCWNKRIDFTDRLIEWSAETFSWISTVKFQNFSAPGFSTYQGLKKWKHQISGLFCTLGSLPNAKKKKPSANRDFDPDPTGVLVKSFSSLPENTTIWPQPFNAPWSSGICHLWLHSCTTWLRLTNSQICRYISTHLITTTRLWLDWRMSGGSIFCVGGKVGAKPRAWGAKKIDTVEH